MKSGLKSKLKFLLDKRFMTNELFNQKIRKQIISHMGIDFIRRPKDEKTGEEGWLIVRFGDSGKGFDITISRHIYDPVAAKKMFSDPKYIVEEMFIKEIRNRFGGDEKKEDKKIKVKGL